MEQVKIGQEIIIKDDYQIKTYISSVDINVKKGDKGFADSKGNIHFRTGEARYKMQKIDNVKLKGFDTQNITKLIAERLNDRYNLLEMLEDFDIKDDDFIGEIEAVLSEIL